MKALRIFALGVCVVAAASAQHVGVPTTDLDKVSVDELFSVEVTSVGRKAQQLAKAPAAVFVLTAADIRRSGATSIPELLQLVPGLTVLQLDGRNWIVSARGGARLYADKMLVMIDGRSVFTRLFSGVMWDTIDVPMDDIEQIEVVRGAGAVMWGPNALNGVINVVTRNSRTTTGTETTVATGSDLALSTEARFGAAPNSRISYRLWGKFDYLDPEFGSSGYFNLPNQITIQEPVIRNLNSAMGRMGVRVDGQPDEADQWMMQGDLYKTDRQDPVVKAVFYPSIVLEQQGHTDYLGGYLQGRWVHNSPDGGEHTLQFSYDRSGIDLPNMGGNLNTLNVNYDWRRQTSERNEIYWGAGYEQYWDKTISGRALTFTPANSTYEVGDTVVRDEWQFVPGKLMGSAGVRFDYNSFHQLEYQPSLRLLFTPDAKQSWWAAASRAVRAPNRVDRDFIENAGVETVEGYPVQLWLYGSKNMKSEVERTVETGYRYQSGQRWSVDASIYWSYYERLRALVGTPPTLSFPNGAPLLTSVVTTSNSGTGRSYGGEIWGTWQVRTGWRISPSYSYLNETRWLPPSPYYSYLWDGTPATLAHQGILRSQHDLARNLQFDLTLRARSRDEALYHLPGVLLVDARLAWRPWSSGEVSLTVHNLAGRQVMEGYPELDVVAIPLRRTFVLKWTQRF